MLRSLACAIKRQASPAATEIQNTRPVYQKNASSIRGLRPYLGTRFELLTRPPSEAVDLAPFPLASDGKLERDHDAGVTSRIIIGIEDRELAIAKEQLVGCEQRQQRGQCDFAVRD